MKPKSKAPARAGKARRATGKSKPTRAPGAAAKVVVPRLQARGDWREETLAEVRRLIYEAYPNVVEERKWVKASHPAGVPVWSHAGIICRGETYKEVVKLTFARGAALEDPQALFNSSLEGNTRRAIDIREGEKLNAGALKALVRAAVAENLRASAQKSKATAVTKGGVAKSTNKPKGEKIVLLSGGNPQIAKADGDAPVQAYIAAMPGWKRKIGEWLDALIEKHVPNVKKAVKWNSPFYGMEGQGWFLSTHCLTKYVKVTFFAGTSLQPIPPGGTLKSKEARWLDIYEDDELDDAEMARWVKQAAAIPGWMA